MFSLQIEESPRSLSEEPPLDLPEVQKLLADQRNVQYYPGLFPATAGAVAACRFSFVHLDVDLYESTRAALEFFYPLMSSGAIIISHDYVIANGVRKAFDEFFEHKAETVLELTGNQCLVVKLGQDCRAQHLGE